MNKDYRFSASVSTKNYEEKPTNISGMAFKESTFTIDELAEAIKAGKAFTNIFTHNGDSLNIRDKKKDNFRMSNFITFDFDHQPSEMNTFISNLSIKPSIAYTTPSDGKNGEYAYRCIYMLDEPVTSVMEYENKYRGLAKELGVAEKIDAHCVDAARYFNGSYSCNTITSDTILKTNQIPSVEREYTAPTKTNRTANEKNEETTVSGDFISDWKNRKLSNEEILSKYQDLQRHSECSERTSDMNGIIRIDDEYIEYRRIWSKDENGRPYIVKVKEGHRNNELYKFGCFVRLANPDVTLDRMMVIMLSEVMAHYEIGDGELLNRNKIQKKAEAIMSIDTDELKFKYDDTRRFKVDREKAKELGVSCQKLAADERTRLHDKEIGLYFDAYKTDKENREVLKKNGVNVTPEFLKKYRERYNCKLQDVQIEYIKNEISKGTKDKDIIDFLNISKGTFYKLKNKIIKGIKNAEQDTDLLNNIVYNFPRKIYTFSEPEKVSENETKDKLQDDTSFDIEPSELRKMLGIPEPVEEPAVETEQINNETNEMDMKKNEQNNVVCVPPIKVTHPYNMYPEHPVVTSAPSFDVCVTYKEEENKIPTTEDVIYNSTIEYISNDDRIDEIKSKPFNDVTPDDFAFLIEQSTIR